MSPSILPATTDPLESRWKKGMSPDCDSAIGDTQTGEREMEMTGVCGVQGAPPYKSGKLE